MILSRSFHWRPIKHNKRHKLKRGPKGEGGGGYSGFAFAENFEVASCQRCNFMHFFLGGGVVGGQSVTGNELFMIIKLDVASSAVSPFSDTILFLKRLSPYCYMCTNINDRRRWLH